RIQPSPKLIIRIAHNTHSSLIHNRGPTDHNPWCRFRLFFRIRYLSRGLEQGQGLDGIDHSPRRAQMEGHGLDLLPIEPDHMGPASSRILALHSRSAECNLLTGFAALAASSVLIYLGLGTSLFLSLFIVYSYHAVVVDNVS